MPDDTADLADTAIRVAAASRAADTDAAEAYRLDAQIGYLLRRASQRHLAIFAERIGDLTSTQFAAMARVYERGPLSQADLGRATAMDAATLKGVVDRLQARGLVAMTPSLKDRRRVIVDLTAEGRALFARLATAAFSISEDTLAPLTAEERRSLLSLLEKIA